jgi:hypothetical protein
VKCNVAGGHNFCTEVLSSKLKHLPFHHIPCLYACRVNTLRTGRIILCFWLLNVADRTYNIMILGHFVLQHTIRCCSAMQEDGCWRHMIPECLLVYDLPLLPPTPPIPSQRMPLFVYQLYVPGSQSVQYGPPRINAVENQAISWRTRNIWLVLRWAIFLAFWDV